MNATLKSICNLLQDNADPDLQHAAIRVIGAIDSREPGVHRALGELLVQTDNGAIFTAILDAFEHSPHEQALRYLLAVLERDGPWDEKVLRAIACIGGKAMPMLKAHFDRVSAPGKRKIVSVLPRIRTAQAHAFMLESCFSTDPELVRQTVASLRENVQDYSDDEKRELHDRLVQALKDRRLKSNDAALSAIIISLGILAEPQAKKVLLPYTQKEYPTQIRRHALMSLARLEYPGRHPEIFAQILPLLTESDYEGLVRHAVQVLTKVHPERAQNAELQNLLGSRHPGVRAFALRALGRLDSITNAERALDFLQAAEPEVRDAAVESLRTMPSAVPVVLRHLDEVRDRGKAFEMVRILEAHDKRIKPDRARRMTQRMIELYRANDDHYQLYRTALLHLRKDVLQAELLKIAETARQKKNWEAMRDTLRLLDHTELLTPEVRYRLALAKLKTSKKDLSRTFRLSDYALDHIAHLLSEDPKDFRRNLLAEKALDAKDLLYVGYHFSEHTNEERRFGVDILRYVVKKWPKTDAAATARKKLKTEGY